MEVCHSSPGDLNWAVCCSKSAQVNAQLQLHMQYIFVDIETVNSEKEKLR